MSKTMLKWEKMTCEGDSARVELSRHHVYTGGFRLVRGMVQSSKNAWSATLSAQVGTSIRTGFQHCNEGSSASIRGSGHLVSMRTS